MAEAIVAEPVGSLRLTGRVIGPDRNGVVGADVWIDSLPRRATKSGADGAFELDGLLGHTYEVRAKDNELVGARCDPR